ncbi:hypothetical protein DSI35_19405, partial [Mycobacterium tuberculosis]
VLATATLIGTTGCFKRGAKGDYALAPEVRPLEVPPDLNVPAGQAAATAATSSSLASQASRPAPASNQAAANNA